MPGPARAVLICALLLLGLTVTNAGVAETVTPELQRQRCWQEWHQLG